MRCSLLHSSSLPIDACQEHTSVSVYDPVFTEEDDALFKQLDIRMLTENKASAVSTGHGTDIHRRLLGGQVSVRGSDNIMGQCDKK